MMRATAWCCKPLVRNVAFVPQKYSRVFLAMGQCDNYNYIPCDAIPVLS
jgi:hypothetical protein